MKKKEWIYREILYQYYEKKKGLLTQRSLSRSCKVSIGLVNKAIEPLERMNAIEKRVRGFLIINPRKALLYWASIRNLDRDIIFQTRIEKPVLDIEKEMPNKAKYTAYSAYKFRFNTTPSDYSEVVVYSDKAAIRSRFGESKAIPNIIVLKSDPHLEGLREVPLAQVFVDLWNLNKWYAQDFIHALEKRMVV